MFYVIALRDTRRFEKKKGQGIRDIILEYLAEADVGKLVQRNDFQPR
jgi:hypothetical protein